MMLGTDGVGKAGCEERNDWLLLQQNDADTKVLDWTGGCTPAAVWYQVRILDVMLEYSIARCGSDEQGQLRSCKTFLMAD
jgi:hypothetical protein